jgi:hypothetical protein
MDIHSACENIIENSENPGEQNMGQHERGSINCGVMKNDKICRSKEEN